MMRLNTLSPELAQSVLDATPEKRGRAVIAACRFALQASGVDAPDAVRFIDLVESGAPISAKLREELEMWAERLDDVYLDALEAAEDGAEAAQLHLTLFAQARAAASILYAADCARAEGAAEAIYEAIASVDLQTIKSIIMDELG